MLAPRASHAYVCLRCELQRRRRRLPACALRRPSPTFSTTARRRDDASASASAPASAPASASEAQLPPPDNESKIRRTFKPEVKVHKRKGKVIRETSARLGALKTLGDTAEILLLREVGGEKPAQPEVPVQPATPVVVPDIYAALQQENEAVPPEEIRRRIEALRPENSPAANEQQHFISHNTFSQVRTDLIDGFHPSQLARFYSHAKKNGPELNSKKLLVSLKPKGHRSVFMGPQARTEWQPGTTPIEKRLPGVDATTKPRRAPVSKQLLVDRIMRELWKLVPLEEVEAPGEIEIPLKPCHLALLRAGENETILSKISDSRKARLEIHRRHGVLRITADKTTAEYAANDVAEALQKIRSKEFHLKPWIPCLQDSKIPKDQKLATMFTHEHLDMVTSLTRTYVQRMDNTSTLLLRALEAKAIAEAERMLIRLLPLKDPVYRTVSNEVVDMSKQEKVGPACTLIPLPVDSSADRLRRNVDVGRWSSPIVTSGLEKRGEGGDQIENLNDSTYYKEIYDKASTAGVWNALVGASKRPRSLPTEKTPNEKDGVWVATPTFKLSAKFGSVLWSMEEQKRKELSDGGHARPQEVFDPHVPGLISLLAAAHQQSEDKAEPTQPSIQATSCTTIPFLVYNFVPAPEQQGFDAGQLFPSLRIQMRTSPTGGKARFHKLNLSFQQHAHDVALPHKAVDIRFTLYGKISLFKFQNNDSVDRWIDAVCANLASGERLTAPPIKLRVPAWTIPGQPTDGKGKAMRAVKYLFAGVSIRQSVSGTFLDTPWSYNTTQSSKLGSQGGSMGMYYPAAESLEALLQDEQGVKKFIEKSFRMAERITEATGLTRPVEKILKPRAEDSERKLRRAEERARAAEGNGVASEQHTAGEVGENASSNAVEESQTDALAALERVGQDAPANSTESDEASILSSDESDPLDGNQVHREETSSSETAGNTAKCSA